MNNTINNARASRSNTSFGSLTSEAQKYINLNNLKKLKISQQDYFYLKSHNLVIDKLICDSRLPVQIEGRGLFLLNPSEPTVNKTEATMMGKYIDIRLTPTKGFFNRKFKNIEETLGKAVKKALKKCRAYDAVNSEKWAYREKYGEEIQGLKSTNKSASDCVELLKETFGNHTIESDKYIQTLEKEIASREKKIAKFKDESHFENKKKEIFSTWDNAV